MTRLLIGPVLRHVGFTDATVWVEVDGPCEVEILGHRERTWSVAGHHYALVTVTGLEPGRRYPYEVRLDGDPVWPLPDDPRPACRIRTLAEGADVDLAFGSCRYSTEEAVGSDQQYDDDALDCYSRDLVEVPEERWPDALLMLGDQVYADDTSEATQQRIRAAPGSPRSARSTRSPTSRSTPGCTTSRGAIPMCGGCSRSCPPR